MITIQHTKFTSGVLLKDILLAMTKEKMLQICKKLDLYVSPNLKKEVTAQRVAGELLDSCMERMVKRIYDLYMPLAAEDVIPLILE